MCVRYIKDSLLIFMYKSYSSVQVDWSFATYFTKLDLNFSSAKYVNAFYLKCWKLDELIANLFNICIYMYVLFAYIRGPIRGIHSRLKYHGTV